jgi:hypothetical protein
VVLRRQTDEIVIAKRPQAYLMSSVQPGVLGEVRAQQLLTNGSSIRGRTREVLPSVVSPISRLCKLVQGPSE